MSNRTDNFNRADGALNGSTPSDGGSAWTDTAPSACSIASNQLRCGNMFSSWQPASLETSTAVGKISFVVKVLGNSGFGFRYVDSSNFWHVQVLSSGLGLYKRVAGTFTLYGSTYSGTISVGDTIEVEVTSGDVWTVKQNSTLRINPGTSDSAHNTATKLCVGGSSGSAKYDDMSFTDTSSAGGLAANPMRGGGAAAGPLWGYL